MINSATGKVIGRLFPVPDHRESYTLPVIYTWSDGSQYVIFGSGGETVPGKSFVRYLNYHKYMYVYSSLCITVINSKWLADLLVMYVVCTRSYIA